MTRTAPHAISLENIREKAPYEGRTSWSDRAGKIPKVLLEMAMAKSMRVNDKNNFVAAKVCSLQNETWKWTLWERILLSRRIVPCRTTSSVANSLQKQRKKFTHVTILANEEAHNFLRSQQANRRSRKQLFRINCPITNFWNEPQTVSKNSSWVKSKKTEEVNKVRCKCFLRVSEFLGEVVCSRMKLLYSFYVSVVCLKRQNWMWIQVHYRTVHPDNIKTRLCLTV